uniref:Uncharacterized protein n=1 Tax=Salix viminalis TaxID=40686 RepID=A0A6N2L9D4_SALVM
MASRRTVALITYHSRFSNSDSSTAIQLIDEMVGKGSQRIRLHFRFIGLESHDEIISDLASTVSESLLQQ